MIKEERTRILQMVAEGKVTPEEADDLLAAVEATATEKTQVFERPPAAPDSFGAHAPFGPAGPFSPQGGPVPPRTVGAPPGPFGIHPQGGTAALFQDGVPWAKRRLVIQVEEDGEQKVNICIPLSLVAAATKVIPGQARSWLEKFDIDINGLMESVAGDGSSELSVDIHDDDNRVQIYME